MRFIPTAVDGAFAVDLDTLADERGSFARTFCRADFASAGIDFQPVQTNISRNPIRGTLRGLHYQRTPHSEAKLIQCVRGRIFDVAVDLRPASPTYLRAASIHLDAGIDRLFFIPEGCAHGFLTRADDSDIVYYMGAAFVAGSGAGVRWSDPAFAIAWPDVPRLISERDAGYPDIGIEAEA